MGCDKFRLNRLDGVLLLVVASSILWRQIFIFFRFLPHMAIIIDRIRKWNIELNLTTIKNTTKIVMQKHKIEHLHFLMETCAFGRECDFSVLYCIQQHKHTHTHMPIQSYSNVLLRFYNELFIYVFLLFSKQILRFPFSLYLFCEMQNTIFQILIIHGIVLYCIVFYCIV